MFTYSLSGFSEKKCGVDGRWVGRTPNDTTNPWGWTNYTGCYAPEVWNVYNKFLANKSDEQKMVSPDGINAYSDQC